MRHANSPLLTVMIKAAEKTARALGRDFGEIENLQLSKKGPGKFVSSANKKAAKILSEELNAARPKFSMIMEGYKDFKGEDPEYTWIVDPLNGTANFAHGIPHCAFSIAVRRKDEIITSLIYNPVSNDMFTAEKGQGAFSGSIRLRVSQKTSPANAVIGFSEFSDLKPTGEIPTVIYRNMGSTALHLAYLAAGKFDAILANNMSICEKAAGSLMIKEAGGFISDLDNGRNILDNEKELVAANPSLHGELLTMIREKGQK